MYKKLLASSAFVFMFFMLFIQCRKNEDVNTNEPYQPVYVSGGVYGNVVNELGKPEPQVKVSNGSNSVMTDQNGVFILQNQLLDKNGAQIKFEKAGYFTIYKSVIPIKNKMVFTKLQLVPKVVTKVIDASSGDVIVANGNAQVSIPANSIADASGKSYSGQMKVYTYWMDPTSNRTPLEMPGNLSGRDKDGKEVVLQTLGMMAVELEDLAGNPLNITTGKFAELKLPIPNSLDAKAQSSIPLWYYNATKGGWIEEGVATRQGNFYVGQVQHFSFWNCDYPFPSINLTGRVLDASGHAIGNASLEILDNTSGRKGYGTTTSDGYFEGKVPASSSFSMTVGVNQCQSPFVFNFSTTTIDLDLGDIKTNLNSFRLLGKIIDCLNAPVTDGYLQVWTNNSLYNSFFFAVDAFGSFDGNLIACVNTDLNYLAVDFKNLKQSTQNNIKYQNQSEIDFGVLTACDDLINVISLNAPGKKAVYLNANCFDDGGILYFFGVGSGRDSAYVNFSLSAVDLNKFQNPLSFTASGTLGSFYYLCNPCTKMNVKITQYGAIGTQIKGTFNGKLNDAITLLEVDVTGTFSVERKN